MPTTLALHILEDLAHGESKKEILLETNPNTELHIISNYSNTVIKLHFGNKFDIVDGVIIIHN